MRIWRPRWLWVILNIAGMATYLKLASRIWVLPGEETMPGSPGDAFYWAFLLVPVLATFLLVNAIALAIAPGARVAVAVWLTVAVLWVGTVAYDHHRSARYIDSKYV